MPNAQKSGMRIKLFALVILLGSLSACAVMDSTNMESAVPLPKNKIDVQAYVGSGTDLTFLAHDVHFDDNPLNLYIFNMSIYAAKFALGLGDDTEIGARTWLAPYSFGGRLYFKKRLYHVGRKSFAIVPGITFVSTYDKDESPNCKAFGYEVPLIFTYEPNDYLNLSSSIRVNRHLYSDKQDADYDFLRPRETIDLIHYGLHQNLSYHSDVFFPTPEVGVIMLISPSRRVYFAPSVSLGIGWRL